MKIKFYTTPSLPSPLQKSPLGRELQTLAVRLHLHSQDWWVPRECMWGTDNVCNTHKKIKTNWERLLLEWEHLVGNICHLPACNTGDPCSIPGLGRFPGEGNGTHSRILAWRPPWTEEPGRLQPIGLQGVGQDWITRTQSLSCSLVCGVLFIIMLPILHIFF